jgi:hypothetical protein
MNLVPFYLHGEIPRVRPFPHHQMTNEVLCEGEPRCLPGRALLLGLARGTSNEQNKKGFPMTLGPWTASGSVSSCRCLSVGCCRWLLFALSVCVVCFCPQLLGSVSEQAMRSPKKVIHLTHTTSLSQCASLQALVLKFAERVVAQKLMQDRCRSPSHSASQDSPLDRSARAGTTELCFLRCLASRASADIPREGRRSAHHSETPHRKYVQRET